MGMLDTPEDEQKRIDSHEPTFELVMYPKDSQGNPLPHTKSVTTDTPFKLWRFWMNNHRPKKKAKGSHVKRKGKNARYKEVLPKGKEADNLAKEVAKYAEKKQQERDIKNADV